MILVEVLRVTPMLKWLWPLITDIHLLLCLPPESCSQRKVWLALRLESFGGSNVLFSHNFVTTKLRKDVSHDI